MMFSTGKFWRHEYIGNNGCGQKEKTPRIWLLNSHGTSGSAILISRI